MKRKEAKWAMAKTYIPTLVNILRQICLYIVRYRTKLVANLPPGGGSALDNIVSACEAFLALVPVDVPVE